MINVEKARDAFNDFLEQYTDRSQDGFELKVCHTYHVASNARDIAIRLGLGEEDRNLAEVIGLLHDIGRFEEITFLKRFDSVKFDHASYGVKLLFDEGLIRKFVDDDSYDEVIKAAIDNHSRLNIVSGDLLDDRVLLHCKIIRDADKLDNFRVKIEENVNKIFSGKGIEDDDFEKSLLSDKVYDAIKKRQCVDIYDRVTVLDYWCCTLAFVFDLNFKESYEIVKDNNYINILIDRFDYNDLKTKQRMEDIRRIINNYIDDMVK